MSTEKKGKIRQFIREHKKEIIIGSGCVLAGVGIYFYVKNCGTSAPDFTAIDKMPTTASTMLQHKIPETISQSASKVFEVRQHIRNLPTGHCASAGKVASALDKGYTLQPGQTWVSNYMKGL